MSLVATGGSSGAVPNPNDCLCSPFWFTQNTFMEHHVRTRQHAIMEKGIITSNIILACAFSVTRNCCPSTAERKCEAIIRLINRMCRKNRNVSLWYDYRYFFSDYDLKRCVKTFFFRPTYCFCFF